MPRLGEKGRLRTALEDGALAELQAVLLERCQVNDADPGSCWIWTGNRNGAYAFIRGNGGRSEYAHRALWRKAYARIPAGLQVHHRCSISLCIRLEHLQLVAADENRAGMLARRALENRIIDLEDALRTAAPGHPLLVAGLDSDVNAAVGANWEPSSVRIERRRAARAQQAEHRATRAEQVAAVQALRGAGMTATAACQQTGIHKSTFYRWRELIEQDGISSATGINRTG